MNISEALQLFLESRRGILSDETLAWYASRLGCLVSFLEDKDLDAITIHDLRRYRVCLVERNKRWADHPGRPSEEGRLSVHTIHGHMRAARAFFRWLRQEGFITHNPAERLEMPALPDEPPKALSHDEMRRILQAAQKHPRDYALVLFLADTGCRVGGLCNLRLRDLDMERRRAVVREKGKGGKRKSRLVFFTEITAQALSKWLEVRRPEPDVEHVFVALRGRSSGKPLTRSGVYQILKRIARSTGVKRFNPHAFRHAFARDMLQNGADLSTVSQLMGHRDVQVTARFYARWSDEELASSHERFSQNRIFLRARDS